MVYVRTPDSIILAGEAGGSVKLVALIAQGFVIVGRIDLSHLFFNLSVYHKYRVLPMPQVRDDVGGVVWSFPLMCTYNSVASGCKTMKQAILRPPGKRILPTREFNNFSFARPFAHNPSIPGARPLRTPRFCHHFVG